MNWRILVQSLLTLSLAVSGGDVMAQNKTRKLTAKASSAKSVTKPRSAATSNVQDLKGKFRRGQITSAKLWSELSAIAENPSGLSRADRIDLNQMQGLLLINGGFPFTGALYLSDVLTEAPDPLDKENRKTWDLLYKTAKARPIQFLLEYLAQDLDLKKTLPPSFNNDWNYYRANALSRMGRDEEALEYYKMIKLGDRYFLPSQYQISMIYLNKADFDKAELSLKTILNPTVLSETPLGLNDKIEIKNYAHMALARISYQRGSFVAAVRQYRNVSRTSPLFYDALFEQGWALFMSGNVPHSLGIMHGVYSPFFKDRFNPEGRVLEAINYYWICRYDDSQRSLAQFRKQYSEGVDGLRDFLDRKKLSSDTSYQLFEDLLTGVSSESLGINRSVLLTAAERDSMLSVRDQYASVVEEREKMTRSGIYGYRESVGVPLGRLEKLTKRLKREIGENFIVELKAMKDHFDDLLQQSQFIYLELLMSQKEQLLGRELHKESKITETPSDRPLKDWGKELQSWEDGKDEYWWDEIGFHIVPVESNCKS